MPKPMTVEVDDFDILPTESCYAIIWIFNVIFYVVNSWNLLVVGMKLLKHRKFDIAAWLQPTKFAFTTNSNEHREYFTKRVFIWRIRKQSHFKIFLFSLVLADQNRDISSSISSSPIPLFPFLAPHPSKSHDSDVFYR